MRHRHTLSQQYLDVARLVSICLMASAAAGSAGAETRPENTSADRPLYHADSGHLWNRLHSALFVRVGPDGLSYGQDRLEPLLWPESKHLLEARSHKRAVAVLNEFLDNNGEQLIEDPLKRALLQRDLWMVFNWLEADHRGFAKPTLKDAEVRSAQERLRRPLAAIMSRLALGPNEIRDLPDNYAAAVASGEFARRFDLERIETPYFPPDLFSADGPWICVGRTDGITAPRHLADDYNRFTNSVFFVFLRLPAGRDATAGYLQKLLAFDEPLLVRNPGATDRHSFFFVPNAKLPQFPQGTEIALVRRALLIDTSHRVVASPLTESVQLRVLHGDIPALTKQVQKDPVAFFREARKQVGSWQSFQEFRLSRSQLLAGRAGGIHAVAADEVDFKTGFRAHPWDEFERSLRPDQSFRKMTQRPIMQNCFACHNVPGVYSFNSLRPDVRFAMQRKDGDQETPFRLAEMTVADVAAATVRWKASRPYWSALRDLLSE